MKYLKVFDNNNEYQQFIGGEDYIEPHILVVKNGDNESVLHFKDNVKNILTFTVGKQKYNFEDGMTWEEFINSKYNVGYFSINGKYVYYDYNSSNYGNIYLTFLVKITDLIKEVNYTFNISSGGSN
jgi:hypothetical protein